MPIKAEPYNYNIQLAKVIDGDTVDVRIDLGFNIWTFERVRLEGIDTAEIYGSQASPAGQAAKTFVTLWASDAKSLRLQSKRYDHREKYGRVLGELYRQLPDGKQDAVGLSKALRDADLQKVQP